ncbi:hypothetical protein MSG28_008087 [Choristoneura fumiferana]|uniref:Uncharacterized protein n=1 Tax=Choristoneura fumiferana TaxID=7141 RepID=A0ACC0J9Y8_CHOFU|nr:hypothetical protein MSG28_008087 [Choristoneura fumiferana]
MSRRSFKLSNMKNNSSSEEETNSGILKGKKGKPIYRKRVRYFDLLPGDIMLSTPTPVVKHTASDKSIFNISGEVIQAQRAAAKPGESKPPLPAKSGFELFKPHSGIVINRDKEFAPDVVHMPGRLTKEKKPKTKPCHKGGKFAAARRREEAKRIKGPSKDLPYTTLGVTDANLKRGTLETHSLTVLPCTKERKSTVHYGILTGAFNMYDAKFGGRSRGRQALTMSVMAYCLAFHYHPKQWTMKLIDNLVLAGDTWYIQCLDKVHDHSKVQGICEVLPFGKKQTLILNRKKMQVLLGEPDVVGYTMSLDPTVYNLCRGLKAFFKDNRAGVLLSRVLKVVIWKDRVCYYLFDPAGRDSRAYSNFATGCAALINVADLESLAEVLLARTVLEDQKFLLAPVKVLKMAPEDADEDFESDKELTQAEKAMMGYRIMNQNCAIVNGNMHLGDRCFEEAKFRQAVPVAVVAMTYAKISPPNTWFTKTLDKILRLGNKLYLDCLHPKVMIDMTIDNIPNEISIGPYACEIIIYRERVKGQLFTTKECLLNIRTGLEDFFSHEYNSGILEFNNYTMAIWRQKEMFYMFDPYPRTLDGERAFKSGRACCWMLLNPSTMAAVFTKNWDYMPASTQFYIHAKKAKRTVLKESQSRGDAKELYHDVLPRDTFPDDKPKSKTKAVEPKLDEEQMGDIISLVDSVQEDYLPPIPMKYKTMTDEPLFEKVVPPWPKPRDKSNELPDPDPDPEPTPPPTPPPPVLAPIEVIEDEVQTVEPPVNVDRKILLTEDAKFRFKLRQLRKKMTTPLTEDQLNISPSEELAKPNNFKTLPDGTGIIRGSSSVPESEAIDILPFAAIMAIVTSYKYTINTWASGIVNFVTFSANIDVVGEGATWQLEDVLTRKFFNKYDRGMITTSTYSCAFFKKNGLYYLFDGSACNPMGLREDEKKAGKACFLRFQNLHDLVARILYNKDGRTEDQQFILSRILVRRLLVEPRVKLPEDYDYNTGRPKSSKSKTTVVDKKPTSDKGLKGEEPKMPPVRGYQLYNGIYRIEGTTSLKDRKGSTDIKPCHFVSLMAMLMAAMHPIRTWDHQMVDICIEKGLEINSKCTNNAICEKRSIKNVIIDGRFININIKKIIVINENPEKRVQQYLKAVLRRLRYVIIRYPQCSMVIVQSEGYYHLFDPYPPPSEDYPKKDEEKLKKKVKVEDKEPGEPPENKKGSDVATWTLYRSQDALIQRLKKTIAGSTVDNPEFYTFELTSVKTAPRHSALHYRLSPLFKPDENPNMPYLRRRRIRPLVDEKMYWLNIEAVPWSRMNPTNDLGFERRTPRSTWKEWDIEFPGDLYSLWGTVHPLDEKFDEIRRGKQYLATCVVAVVMTQACSLSAWTGSFLDGIVNAGDRYHAKCYEKFKNAKNVEIKLADLPSSFDMFPYSFSVKFENIIFGFVYNIYPDRFNLSKALDYFFEKETLGILTSPAKNLAFGRVGKSYFMYDCQSFGAPVWSPGYGGSYMLKCESLNRLVYCMALTLNIRRHGQQFHLFSVSVSLSEKSK